MYIEYNNKKYYFNNTQTLSELLKKGDFLDLPLSKWKELLIMKQGSISEIVLNEVLIEKIKHYDKSKNVNSFNYNNNSYWLDKNTRLSLVNLANSTEEPISLFLEQIIVEIDPQHLKQFLQELEVYASKCYINTQKHLLKAKEIVSLEDLINYDYTEGYPNKIMLNE